MKNPHTPKTYFWPTDNMPGFFHRTGKTGSWCLRLEDGVRFFHLNTRCASIDEAIYKVRHLREMLADAGIIGPKELARREGIPTLDALALITKKGGACHKSDTKPNG